jgi:hypothetical protein
MKSVSIKAGLLLSMALAPGAFSEEPVSPPAAGPAATNLIGAVIQFDALMYDFGRIVAGQMVKHDFVFTNIGDAVLEISGVHPSCGCTTAGAWSSRVEPGKTGAIPLLFNSGHYNGPVTKTASVICNDKSHQQVTLVIKGTIWKPIEVNPPMAVLNVVADAPSNPPAIITIVSSLPEPVTLSDPISSNRAFAAEIKTIQPGKEFQLIITRVPPIGPTTVQGTISIKTSSTNAPSIQVNALAIVQPAWVVTPQEIALPPGPLGTAFPCAVSVRNNTTVPMTLSDPAVNADNVPVTIREVLPGRQFTLSLSFPAGFRIARGEQVNLTVTTSDPKNPVLRLPIRQNMLPSSQEVGLPTHHRGPVPPVPPH